ncbi:MAG TPA: LLM class F420-dependent oxidoreductase [Myxococcales bacterium]|nr:LLM class F420-dependent oxidoreductase [Myxococcales bacterium]HIK85489.1 LLM class F420-dependent oxidoreductase [Myxococcales bacterium]
MKIGIVYPQTELRGRPEAIGQIGLSAEELGFNHILFYDHVVGAVHAGREPKLQGPYTEADPFHDPFVALGYLAGITERIELVSGVLILPQRQTVLVAQQASDVDLLSGERLRLGVGTGWNYVEYDALGQDFASRGARMTEQIEFMRALWTNDLLTFKGQFDSIDRGNINPRPKRSIPIWVGGFSEPAFRRGGKLGDGFIFAGPTDSVAGQITGVLDAWKRVQEHLTDNERTTQGFGADYVMLASLGVEATADTIKRWQDAGGTHASVVTMGMGLETTEAHLDYMANVAAKVGLSSQAPSS